MNVVLSILVFGGLLGLLSSATYFVVHYRNMKTEHNRLVSDVEQLENDFLAGLKNTSLDELKETTAGRELIKLLQDSEILPETPPYEIPLSKSSNEKSSHDHLNLGNVLFRQKRFEEAEAAFRQAIEQDPNYTAAYSNLGILLTQQGRFEEAEVSFRQAIEKDPNAAVGYSNLGNLLTKQGRFEEAEVALRQAIEKNPTASIKNKDEINVSSLHSLRDRAINMQKALQAENIVIEENNVKVVITGDQIVESIELGGSPEPDLVNALNIAIQKSQKLAAQKLQELSSRI